MISSLIASAIICHYKGDDWEQYARRLLYKLKGGSIPAYHREHVDSLGVPYVVYDELNGVRAGKQYNPTIVSNYALEYYDGLPSSKDDEQSFWNCVKWLEENMSYRNDAALYVFNWQQPWYDSVGVPYTSGMSSGLAVNVFSKAYLLSKDEKYLALAKKLVNGFFIPISEGGFTYMENEGWWFEEFADTAIHTPFVLDGHIFALTGVHEYWKITKNDSAATVIQKGVTALKNKLPQYDIGNGWAYYDKYKLPADKHYQRVLTSQMQQLSDITGDAIFASYYNKWKAPLSRPYLIRVVEERNISGIVLFLGVTVFFLLPGLVMIRFVFKKKDLLI